MNEHVRDICKLGQKSACCRYLVIGANGFECMKITEMKGYLDSRVAMKTIISRGDNCNGRTIEELNSK